MGHRHVVQPAERLQQRRAAGHAQGLEDARRDEIVPAHARDRLDELPRRDPCGVVVLEGGAQPEGDGLVTHLVQDLFPAPTAPVPEAVAAHEARIVAHQVAHAQIAGDVGVAEPEGREVVDDRVVPGDLALVHEHGHGGGGEGLGCGPHRKDRVLVDRIRPPDLLDAEAARIGDLVALNHRDRDAGNIPVPHHVAHGVLQPGEPLLGGTGDRGQEGEEGQEGEDRGGDRGSAETGAIGSSHQLPSSPARAITPLNRSAALRQLVCTDDWARSASPASIASMMIWCSSTETASWSSKASM